MSTDSDKPECPKCGASGTDLIGNYSMKVDQTIDGNGQAIDLSAIPSWVGLTTEWMCEECGWEWTSQKARP